MMIRSCLIVAAICIGFAVTSFRAAVAVPIVYLSPDPLGVATPAVPDLRIDPTVPGSLTGQLNIFMKPDVDVSGVGFDLSAVGSAIEFASATVNNPSSRWSFLDGPLTIDDAQIRNVGGFAIPPGATGVGPGTGGAGFDPVSGYLMATIGYQVTGAVGSSSEIFLQTYIPQYCDGPCSILQVYFPTEDTYSARITVVPEPMGILPLLATVICIGGRRRAPGV